MMTGPKAQKPAGKANPQICVLSDVEAEAYFIFFFFFKRTNITLLYPASVLMGDPGRGDGGGEVAVLSFWFYVWLVVLIIVTRSVK